MRISKQYDPAMTLIRLLILWGAVVGFFVGLFAGRAGAATTWPAGTNVANTFFQTNRFLKQVTFGTPATNTIADSGSTLNGVGLTNHLVYADWVAAAPEDLSIAPSAAIIGADGSSGYLLLIDSGSLTGRVDYTSANGFVFTGGDLNGNGAGITNISAGVITGTLDNTNMPDPMLLSEIKVGTLVLTNPPVLNLGSSTNYTGATTSTNGLAPTNWVGSNFQLQSLAATTNGFVGSEITNNSATIQRLTDATNDLKSVIRVQLSHSTNTSTMAPNFNLAYSRIGTNAAFAFLPPLNVSGTLAQTAVILVTNITGVAIAVTSPVNVHTQGTWNITNATIFTFWNYGSFFTNAIAFPLW